MIFKDKVAPPLRDQNQIDSLYKYWRIHLLIATYAGYAVFYFTRKSLVFAQPGLIDAGLIDKVGLGILGTIFYFTYGASKFISGMMSDSSSPRYFMSTGLIMTGIINILFAGSASFWEFAVLWGLNAFFQGWGWPPSATILTNWYSRNERGKWWSIWNTSHNLGGLLIPLIVGVAVTKYGWKAGMYTPGVIAIVMGIILMIRLRGRPESMGLPRVGEWRKDQDELNYEAQSEKLNTVDVFLKYILRNPMVWTLCLVSFVVYIIRTAINDWGNLYMVGVLHYDTLKANSVITFFELGGFVGSLVAGWGSDIFFKGRRGPMNFIFCVGVCLTTIFFYFVAMKYIDLTPEQVDAMQSNSAYYVNAAVFALLGFFIFGPQMLVGMLGAESTHKNAAGTATGFLGFFSYMGAATAGFPVALIIKHYSWHGFFITMIICGLIIIASMVIFMQQSRKMAQRHGLTI